jgi:prepilin-type processing-associated H-X9-DG protein
MYQVMPFIEGSNVWSERSDFKVMREGPVEGTCPSRRPPTLHAFWQPTGEMLSDYSGNGGDTDDGGTYTKGLSPASRNSLKIPIWYTGVIIPQDLDARCNASRDWQNPLVAIKHVLDGTAKTMLLAEKFVPIVAYQGGAFGDNFGWHQGNAWEGVRYSDRAPIPDTQIPYGVNPNTYPEFNGIGELGCQCDHFGGPHPGGFNAALCDGSVRVIRFDIDHDAFKALTNRQDGQLHEMD